MEFYKETKFKDTEIGKIPEDWDVVRLGDILSLEYGKGLPERERIPGKYPVVGSNGIVGYHNQALVKGPGIVIGRKGTIGAVNWIDSDFWPIDTTYYVKTKRNNIFLKWLFYELSYLNLSRLHLSDVVPGLKRELVYSMKAPLPPLPEQQKIAEILSTVDQAIQKTDEIIAKTERLKKGLMQEVLSGRVRIRVEDGRIGFYRETQFKDTEIGKIPEDWEVVRLKEVLLFIRNGLSLKQNKEGNGYPVTRIETIAEERIDPSKLGYVTQVSEKDLKEYKMEIGDILFSHINSLEHIGKTAIYEGEPPFLLHGMNLLLLRPNKDRVDPKYLLYLLRLFRMRKIFQAMAKKAVNQASINQTELGRLRIFLPPLFEQKKIAEILSTVDKKLEIERKEKERLERIKKGLMDVLLTGKVRVKV